MNMILGWYKILRVFFSDVFPCLTCRCFWMASSLLDVPAGCHSADLHIPVLVVQESSHSVSKVNSLVFT